jgi:hypothetical protein
VTTLCDLRKRKDELQRTQAYLVAYDIEKLRRLYAGQDVDMNEASTFEKLRQGVDVYEASNSPLARECICANIVPIKSWYGEVTVTLDPPDTTESDVFVLLRVVKSSNLRDIQDWHPMGDPILVRVELRVSREDKKSLQKLRQEVEAMRELVSESRKVLNRSLDEEKDVESHAAKLRADFAKPQVELRSTQDDVKQMYAQLDEVKTELIPAAAKDPAMQAEVLVKLRNVIQEWEGKRHLNKMEKKAAAEDAAADKDPAEKAAAKKAAVGKIEADKSSGENAAAGSEAEKRAASTTSQASSPRSHDVWTTSIR